VQKLTEFSYEPRLIATRGQHRGSRSERDAPDPISAECSLKELDSATKRFLVLGVTRVVFDLRRAAPSLYWKAQSEGECVAPESAALVDSPGIRVRLRETSDAGRADGDLGLSRRHV
jgi:hypothetical protein